MQLKRVEERRHTQTFCLLSKSLCSFYNFSRTARITIAQTATFINTDSNVNSAVQVNTQLSKALCSKRFSFQDVIGHPTKFHLSISHFFKTSKPAFWAQFTTHFLFFGLNNHMTVYGHVCDITDIWSVKKRKKNFLQSTPFNGMPKKSQPKMLHLDVSSLKASLLQQIKTFVVQWVPKEKKIAYLACCIKITWSTPSPPRLSMNSTEQFQSMNTIEHNQFQSERKAGRLTKSEFLVCYPALGWGI